MRSKGSRLYSKNKEVKAMGDEDDEDELPDPDEEW
jgi:hypothetical protein